MQNSETRPITLLFDLETTPLSQEDVELHCLVTLDYETGETTRYNDTGSAEPISRGVTYLMTADTIIGHNIIGFDDFIDAGLRIGHGIGPFGLALGL